MKFTKIQQSQASESKKSCEGKLLIVMAITIV